MKIIDFTKNTIEDIKKSDIKHEIQVGDLVYNPTQRRCYYIYYINTEIKPTFYSSAVPFYFTQEPDYKVEEEDYIVKGYEVITEGVLLTISQKSVIEIIRKIEELEEEKSKEINIGDRVIVLSSNEDGMYCTHWIKQHCTEAEKIRFQYGIAPKKNMEYVVIKKFPHVNFEDTMMYLIRGEEYDSGLYLVNHNVIKKTKYRYIERAKLGIKEI